MYDKLQKQKTLSKVFKKLRNKNFFPVANPNRDTQSTAKIFDWLEFNKIFFTILDYTGNKKTWTANGFVRNLYSFLL